MLARVVVPDSSAGRLAPVPLMRPREGSASDSWPSPTAATPANEMTLLQLWDHASSAEVPG
jgi:hypothetical protein